MVRALLTSLALVALSLGAAALAPPGHAAGADAPLASPDAQPASLGSDRSRRFVPGQLLVRFRSTARPRTRLAARRRLGVTHERALPVPGLELVRLRRGRAVRSAAAALKLAPEVLYAEPNFLYRLAAVPDDARFGELWGLSSSGQPVAGTAGAPDADIDAPEAWDITTGSPSVVVAVADSGLAYDHPEIAPNLWTNPGEKRGGRTTNRRDDDRNGRVDDWRGWDFVDKDNDPRDLNGHGTHVAGTIGARGGNGAGIAGVGWRVKLMPLRVADTSGAVSSAAAVSAFDYAADQGAAIVNASFGSEEYSRALLDTIRRNPRTLFVTSAGNGGDDGAGDSNDQAPEYPCTFSARNLICVAASDRADGLAAFSNFGPRSVDLAAPGVSTLSTTPAYAPPLLSEGFENDIGSTWVTGGVNNGWGRITTVAASGSYSLSDSPGAAYLDNTDSFVRTLNPFSLSGKVGCRVSYAVRLSTEPELDQLFLEVSPDGARWVGVSDLSGSTLGFFRRLTDDLYAFQTWSTVFLRFRLATNGSVTADGAQIDDIDVRCLGASYTGDELAFEDGTSMAAPHVSGTAALIWSRYPTIGVGGVREAILRGVDVKPSLAGKTATGGRLNARRALDLAPSLLPRLELTGSARQRGTRKRAVVVFARCRKGCVLVANGRLSVAGSSRKVGLRKITRSLRGGRRRLVIPLTRRALTRARRALARRKRVTALITLTATDRKGNSIRRRRAVTLRR
jgi:subtilisin family serine protease